MRGGQDVSAFPEFYAEYDAASGLGKRLGNRIVVNGPLQYSKQQVSRDIANLQSGLAKTKTAHPSLQGFLPVVAPASALPGAKLEHYKDEEAFLTALADALHQEYKAIVDAGLYVQVDDAFLPYMHERMVPPMSNADYRRWAQMRVDALNHALRGIPEERSRYHICWGSWNGPHTSDVPLRTLLDLVLKVKAQAYTFEAAGPRHAHEYEVLGEVKIPDGKILLPGVISHATNVVEHPELVSMRIRSFAKLVGRENVIASTDCGFSQNWNHLRVHPQVQWAKLQTLVEGARHASKILWR
jgi:5-methyltetrahydropteroyltriglutamate--homocysteine methyltransferase